MLQVHDKFTLMIRTTLKRLTLSTCLLLGFSPTTRAENLESIANPIISQQVNWLEPTADSDIAQTPRRRRRTRTSRTIPLYYGFGVGIFLPQEINFNDDNLPDDAAIDFGNGFAFDLFLGYKFSQNFGAELDITAAFGGVEFSDVPEEDFLNEEDIDYSVVGLYIGPRLELPLAGDRFSLYAVPEIGFSTVNTNNDTDFDGDGEDDSLTSDSGFSYQIKGGGAYKISDRVSIFGQARYNSYFLEDIDNLNGITLEVGASF